MMLCLMDLHQNNFATIQKRELSGQFSKLKYAAKASQNLGLNASATFSGALLWHTMYPWPQRPAGLVETGFEELAKRWLPILNTYDECGVDLCYEIHPGEDLHDGVTYEMFLEKVNNHAKSLLIVRSFAFCFAMP
ncbi:MAG: TIM barrel protein [Segetibacter sp.]